jgi:hypothetical protein
MVELRAHRPTSILAGTLLLCGALLSGSPARGQAESFRAEASRPLRSSSRLAAGSMRTAWLSMDWAYRYEFAVRPDSIAGDGPLTDFALLLPLSDSAMPGVFDRARPDGSDLIFTAGDGVTRIAREIVSYDPANRRAEIWLRADSLSRRSNTFYLYCGNPDTSLAAADGSVWDSADLGVFHFAEDPGAGLLRDYGPHGHHATPVNGWTSADTAAGAIGQAWHLNGTTHWIDADAIASTDSCFTISAWFAVHDLQSPGADFAFQSQSGYWHLSAKRNETYRNADFAGASGFISWMPDPLPDSQLHHFVWVMDGEADTLRFYFDGEQQAIRARWAPQPPHRVYTGSPIGGHVSIAGPIYGNAQDLFSGIADELRIHAGVRSAERILTEYRNQSAGASFYTFGPEQVSAAPEPGPLTVEVTPLHAYPNPFRDQAVIGLRLAGREAVRIEIFDPAGRRVRSLVFPSAAVARGLVVWDGRDDHSGRLESGVYTVRATTAGAVWAGRVVLLH